jgi:hypothetical protein
MLIIPTFSASVPLEGLTIWWGSFGRKIICFTIKVWGGMPDRPLCFHRPWIVHTRRFLALNSVKSWIFALRSYCNMAKIGHGVLYRWRGNSFPFFLYQKLKEILIRYSRIILTASKDRLISKIWRVCLKNWACHAHLNFEV